VRDVVDGTGARQNHFVYDSFGNVTNETNPSFDTRFSFTGREFDVETGNYDYRNRQLRPSSGRFIESDPMSFAGLDVNLYRYANNSPIDLSDPLGYQAVRNVPVYRGNTRPGINPNRPYWSPNYGSGGTTPPRSPSSIPSSNPSSPYIHPSVFRALEPNTSNNSSNPLQYIEDYAQQFCDPIRKYCLDPNQATPEALTKLRINQMEYYLNRAPNPQRSIPLGEFDPTRAFSPFAPNPNQCNYDGECKPRNSAGVPIQGGSYASVRDNNIGGEIHHMPAWAAVIESGVRFGQLSESEGRNQGPAICMTEADHARTASYKGSPLSRRGRYRGDLGILIRLGAYGFNIAQNIDILDVRGKFGFKYDYGIRQMTNYTELLQSQNPALFR
jgi:RHS repeat-associated protein